MPGRTPVPPMLASWAAPSPAPRPGCFGRQDQARHAPIRRAAAWWVSSYPDGCVGELGGRGQSLPGDGVWVLSPLKLCKGDWGKISLSGAATPPAPWREMPGRAAAAGPSPGPGAGNSEQFGAPQRWPCHAKGQEPIQKAAMPSPGNGPAPSQHSAAARARHAECSGLGRHPMRAAPFSRASDCWLEKTVLFL